MGLPKPPKAGGFAQGGAPHKNVAIPIRISDGEFTVPPDVVNAIGGGDQERGHAILDAFIKHQRKLHIKTLRQLPPPAKD
jgi:hypothetical protein